MKMNLSRFTTNSLRFAACISAICLGLGTISANAAGSATVNLAGAKFGNGLDVHLNSGTTLLPAASSYNYDVSGTVHFTGLLTLVFPNAIELAALLNQIEPGSSSILSGSYPNPTGTLPLRILNRTFSGTVPVPGGQTANVSLKVVAKVTATGLVRFDVTQVNFSISGVHIDVGTVVFDTGSLVVSVPSVIEFKSNAISVAEDVGTASVRVKRRINSTGAVSVHYASSPGTADNIDYTPVSGDLNFADGETTKAINVTIAKRAGNQGRRTFKLKLSAPSGRAVLGSIRKEVVTITDVP